jgi:CRISPR-associated protein Cas1
MNTLSRQVHFCEDAAGFGTALAIIRQKIRNQRGLLLSRSQNTKRGEQFALQKSIDDSAARLNKVEFDLGSLDGKLSEARQKIFLNEARAAQVYWETFALLIGDPDWRRAARSHADIANNLLDAGYHMLFQKIEKLVRESGLSPEVGVLHSEDTSLPLVYDLTELWRQPLVDISVLNFLRRHRLKTADDGNYVTRVLFDIKHRMEEKTVRYEKECVRTDWVMKREIVSLRKNIEKNIAWQPARYLWGRSQYCK